MTYDVAVIGAGPGGYVAAIRMGQLGQKVALIEEGDLGGVCLNRGCIPTKALYSATKLLAQASDAKAIGIEFSPPIIDLPRLAAWKEGVIAGLTDGIASLLTANGVTVYQARGGLDGPGQVSLSTGERIIAERIVLATGSSPMEIPGFSFSDPYVWSSDDALALTEIPQRLLIIGGGVIGLELATIYNRLGSRVTVIEMMPEILPGIDLDRRTIATLKRLLKEQQITVHLQAAAKSIEPTSSGVVVRIAGDADSYGDDLRRDDPLGDDPFEADRILLAVGRRPNSAQIGLETVGITPDRRGAITVDATFQTSASGVYAIGDLVPGPMLAHKASYEALLVADPDHPGPDHLGPDHPGPDHLDPDDLTRASHQRANSAIIPEGIIPEGIIPERMIPQAIFTDPEIASVGLSERRAIEEGHKIVVGRFPYAALGKAQGMRETHGFFQIVAAADSGCILGAQIIGADASTLIAEAALAVQNKLSLSALADCVHAHPTLPEGLKEAAEAALGRAIHAVNRPASKNRKRKAVS